jgi:hypothetical protein
VVERLPTTVRSLAETDAGNPNVLALLRFAQCAMMRLLPIPLHTLSNYPLANALW